MIIRTSRRAGAVMLVLWSLAWGFSPDAQGQVTCNQSDLNQNLAATFEQHGATRVLALKGGIVSGSSQVVERALYSGRPFDQIWLCSGGGQVSEGLQIGRLFSRARAWVRVPRGFLCASSCTIMTLGGYLRTIDEGANFVVHASSGIREISAERWFVGDCNESSTPATCWGMAMALLESALPPCTELSELKDPSHPCAYVVLGEAPRPYQYAIKAVNFMKAAPERKVLATFASVQLDDSVAGAIELLQYYQQMLNDGNERALDAAAYSTIRAQRAGIADIYDSGVRDLSQDLASITAAAPDQRAVVWQELLTQIELYGRRGVVTSLEPRSASLGRGGKAALKLLDAMTRCRIQSACFLDTNTVAELGFSNFEIK